MIDLKNNRFFNEDYLKEINWQIAKAKEIQKSILPDKLKDWNCINFAARYYALDQVGGDYYDLFPIKGNKIGLVIADVSGHGIPAAFITTMAKVTFNFFARLYDSPDIILKHVNDELVRYLPNIRAYITCFFLVIDKDLNVKYTNAGHPHAIIYRNETNTFEHLDTEGLFVGAFDDAGYSYEVKETKLCPGDRIILYTDGIIETKNEQKEDYGYQRFEDMVVFSSALSNDKLADLIIDDIIRFAQNEPIRDDISILILEVQLKYNKYLEERKKTDEYEKTSDIEKWILQAKKVLEINPDDLYLIENLAKIYYYQKDYITARKYCVDYVLRNEENYLIYYMLANINYINKNYDRAVADFATSVKLNPTFAFAHNNLAISCIKKGQIKRAKESIIKAFEIDPSNQKIKNNYNRIMKIKL